MFRNYTFFTRKETGVVLRLALTINSLPRFFFQVRSRWYKKGKQIEKGPPKILLIKPDHLGDSILAIPAIQNLRERFHESYIAAVVGSCSLDLWQKIPYINELFVFDYPYDSKRDKKRLSLKDHIILQRNIWKLSRELQAKAFDIAIDLRSGSDWLSMLLAYLSGAHVRIGDDKFGSGFLLTKEMHHNEYEHNIQLNLKKIGYLGISVNSPQLEIPGSEEEHKYIENFLSQQNIDRTRLLIGLHPGAGSPAKCWIDEEFAHLGNLLGEEFNAQIILTGTADELPKIEKIANLMKKGPVIAAGKTNIFQLAALISKFDLLISVDSAPIHIASAMKTPVVALFSGTNQPEEWGPYGNRHVVIRKETSCSPCYKAVCPKPNHECMELITAEDVVKAAKDVLKRVNE